MAVSVLDLEDVARFLRRHHGGEVEGLELLRGGFWSAAYGYRTGGDELVARFGGQRHGFEMDRAAVAFRRANLPVPDVLAVGDAFGGAFAISRRSSGTFLEEVTVEQAPAVAPALGRLLAALREAGVAATAATEPCAWYPAGVDPVTSTWRGWLLDGLVDDPARTVHGWRARLAEVPALDRRFERAVARVRDLLDACPERRDLVHGDLLHQNVLVDPGPATGPSRPAGTALGPDGDRERADVSAVFSWKCSVLGDFAFDVAWCTFWSAWHPGIAAADPWGLTVAADDLDAPARVDLAARHHVYEVHIGVTHLGWNAWTGDAAELAAVAARLDEVLERGPLAVPPAPTTR